MFVGVDPKDALKTSLNEIPIQELTARERVILASLDTSSEQKEIYLSENAIGNAFLFLRDRLLSPKTDVYSNQTFNPEELLTLKKDPLIFRVVCDSITNQSESCIDKSVAERMALRLALSQSLPFLATFLGIILLIRQGWVLLRNGGLTWQPLVAIPLPLIDMVLLIAGGFVVLGEVLLPALILPLTELITKGIGSPLKESLRVLIGYVAMTLPPLFILRQQLRGIDSSLRPPKGWLQWGFSPFLNSFVRALKGWLMIMPLVLLTSWLMNVIVGDQGGSNPLLELVLGSRDSIALALLLITTVLLAPLFEEVVFRGVLLPVLAKEFGNWSGVLISALIFALAHLSVGELPPLFVLGIGLGLLRLTSARLFPCILMHSLWNGITFTSLLLLGG